MFDVFVKGLKPVSETCKKCKDEDTRFGVPFSGAKKEEYQSKKGENDEEIDELFNFNLNVASNNATYKNKKREDKRKAKRSLREALISEALLKMLNESMGIEISNTDSYNLMKRNLVESFVHEKNAIELLDEFKYTSVEMANIALLCEEYTEKIFQEVEGYDDEYMINSKEKNNFFDSLKAIDTSDITNLVSARVSSAIADFTYQNKELKDKMQSVLQRSQEIVNSSDDSEIKESATINAKYKISGMKDNRVKTIFESMVEKISEASILNETMSAYMNESGLDMVKIVENCKVMYTFLELLNTAKLEKINETYVKDILDNLK